LPGGEPAIIVRGAGIEIFDATSARLGQRPMTPERIKKALAATYPSVRAFDGSGCTPF
jgi:CO/xanthine dehydrogenase Mo-binding subunit